MGAGIGNRKWDVGNLLSVREDDDDVGRVRTIAVRYGEHCVEDGGQGAGRVSRAADVERLQPEARTRETRNTRVGRFPCFAGSHSTEMIICRSTPEIRHQKRPEVRMRETGPEIRRPIAPSCLFLLGRN